MGGFVKAGRTPAGRRAAPDAPARTPAGLAEAMANTPLGRTAQMIRDSPLMQARAAALRAAYGPALDPLPPVQRGAPPGPAGLPGGLKGEAEARSGLATDDVRVHRDSPAPGQAQALATAQATDILRASGQERHPANGVAVDDDPALKREADATGPAAPGSARVGPSPGGADRTVQRRVERHKPSEVGEDLEGVEKVAEALSGAVDTATAIIKANPTFKGRAIKKGGYLDAWTKVFATMLETKGIPEFFYARYGYAVETLATDLMRTMTFAGLQVESQVATGATRPDFVVSSRREQLGWLDVTSEASQGHIFKKQHSGWTNRPYVAEILYPPPGVTDFGSGELSESQKSSLREIETNNAQDELDYDNGLEALGIVIQDALEAAAAKSSDGRLGASVTKTVVTRALKAVVGGGLTASIAGQILRCVEVITVNGSVNSGLSWANWAFGAGGYKAGRKAIIAYGARLRGGGQSRGEAMDTNEQEEEFGDENDAAMEENSDDEEKSE